MDIEEFKGLLQQYEKELEIKKKNLIIKYCLENAKYKVGETIEDDMGKITIQKVRASYFYSEPETVYDGIVLTKAGQQSKRGETRSIWQKNIVSAVAKV
jgi:hypothetical protein